MIASSEKVSVLINNYNYARFLEEAVNSALSQTFKPFEIVIVDDGSTDESPALLDRLAKLDTVRVIRKSNGGQLSAFNAGVAESKGDYLFFLDADDRYAPEYLENAITAFRENPSVDFLFSDTMKFGQESGPMFDYKKKYYGLTACRTYYSRQWIGANTSALAISRDLAMRIFPLPDEKLWRICADTALIWVASLVGAVKLQLPCIGVEYRFHGNNLWANNNVHSQITSLFQIARIFRNCWDQFGVDDHIIRTLFWKEVRSIQNFDKKDFRVYHRILWDNMPFGVCKKISLDFKLRKICIKGKLGEKGQPDELPQYKEKKLRAEYPGACVRRGRLSRKPPMRQTYN